MKKIIFCARRDLLTHAGGDTTQILKTKQALENTQGLEVVLALDATALARHKDADLVHIFNIQTIESSLEFADAAQALSLPIALSPIYWNLWPSAFAERIRSIAPFAPIRASAVMETAWRMCLQGSRLQGSLLGKKYIDTRKSLIDMARLILPNSPEELAIICSDLRIDKDDLASKSRVIPNAVDTSQWDPGTDTMQRPPSVAIVGRIEPTKNQLDLIRALSHHRDLSLRIIGRFSSNPLHRKYCEAVRREIDAHPHIHLVNEIPHPEVHRELRKTLVHVLPSFRESPGLTTLEALYAGCNIVTSGPEYCPIHYYWFDKLGTQCHPFSVDSIRKSVLRELNERRARPADDYFAFFSYENAARLTTEAYRQLQSGTLCPMTDQGRHTHPVHKPVAT